MKPWFVSGILQMTVQKLVKAINLWQWAADGAMQASKACRVINEKGM
jgi:hypothetical protein